MFNKFSLNYVEFYLLSVFLIVKLGLYFIYTRSDCRFNDHFCWRICPVSWKSSLFVPGTISIIRIENATGFHRLRDRVLISLIDLFILDIARWHFPARNTIMHPSIILLSTLVAFVAAESILMTEVFVIPIRP